MKIKSMFFRYFLIFSMGLVSVSISAQDNFMIPEVPNFDSVPYQTNVYYPYLSQGEILDLDYPMEEDWLRRKIITEKYKSSDGKEMQFFQSDIDIYWGDTEQLIKHFRLNDDNFVEYYKYTTIDDTYWFGWVDSFVYNQYGLYKLYTVYLDSHEIVNSLDPDWEEYSLVECSYNNEGRIKNKDYFDFRNSTLYHDGFDSFAYENGLCTAVFSTDYTGNLDEPIYRIKRVFEYENNELRRHYNLFDKEIDNHSLDTINQYFYKWVRYIPNNYENSMYSETIYLYYDSDTKHLDTYTNKYTYDKNSFFLLEENFKYQGEADSVFTISKGQYRYKLDANDRVLRVIEDYESNSFDFFYDFDLEEERYDSIETSVLSVKDNFFDPEILKVDEKSKTDLVFYPNPTQSKVKVKSTTKLPQNTKSIILSLDGRIISENTHKNEIEIDFSGLKNGLYLVKIMDQFGVEISHQIIQMLD